MYEITLIHLKLVIAFFTIGIVAYLIFKNHPILQKVGKFESVFYSMIICGSYLTFLFLSLNFLLSSNTTEISTYKVKCKVNKIWNSDDNVKAPTVVKAEFSEGFHKRIGLSKDFKLNNIHPDSLDIHLSVGYFGCPIIRKVEFKKRG